MNSTTNIMLTRMERGETFEEAVRYCQSIGVAEADPSGDVDGWDASIKVAALVPVLMKVPMTPGQVERTGIRGITPAMIAAARSGGRRYKLVCSAQRQGDGVRASVAPELVEPSDPLYVMEDSTTGAAFRTDVLGDYSIIESEREGMVAGPELAETKRRTVGCIAIVELSHDVAQLRWYLVDPSARGAGIGGRLLSEALDFCRACGYRSVGLWTADVLAAAAHLYRSAGFRKVEEKPGSKWGVRVTEEKYELELTSDRPRPDSSEA